MWLLPRLLLVSIVSLCITKTGYLQQFQLVRAGAAAVLPSKHAFATIIVMHQCYSHPIRTHLDN